MASLGLLGGLAGLAQGGADFAKMGMQDQFETMRAERLAQFKQNLEDSSWTKRHDVEHAEKVTDLKEARTYAEGLAEADRARKTDWSLIPNSTRMQNKDGENFDTHHAEDGYALNQRLQNDREDARAAQLEVKERAHTDRVLLSAAVAQYQQDVRDYNKLLASGTASKEDLDAQNENVQNSRVQVEAAKKAAKESNYRATPRAGRTGATTDSLGDPAGTPAAAKPAPAAPPPVVQGPGFLDKLRAVGGGIASQVQNAGSAIASSPRLQGLLNGFSDVGEGARIGVNAVTSSNPPRLGESRPVTGDPVNAEIVSRAASTSPEAFMQWFSQKSQNDPTLNGRLSPDALEAVYAAMAAVAKKGG